MDVELGARLAAIEARLEGLERVRDAPRTTYPWHELKAKGDRFTHECDWREADRVRRSIASNAIGRFGKGVVSTKIIPAGVLVMRRK
mgnify:CR=1 FL=1|jgi:hypothetical protein